MIWILWLAWIVIESRIHTYIINRKYDPTPDGKTSWSGAVVITSRIAVYLILWYWLGMKYTPEFIMFTLGCFFTHLLLFPIILNLFRGEPIYYLGNGVVDRVLKLLPFEPRVWFLLVLSIVMIYGYYHSELL